MKKQLSICHFGTWDSVRPGILQRSAQDRFEIPSGRSGPPNRLLLLTFQNGLKSDALQSQEKELFWTPRLPKSIHNRSKSCYLQPRIHPAAPLDPAEWSRDTKMASQGLPQLLKSCFQNVKMKASRPLNDNPKIKERPAAEGVALKIILGSFWNPSGIVLGSWWDHFQMIFILITFWYHSAVIFENVMLGSF